MKIVDSFKSYFDGFIEVLPDVAIGLVFLIVGLLAVKFISKLLLKLFTKVGLDDLSERVGLKKLLQGFGVTATLPKIISMIVYYMLLLFVLLLASEQMNIAALTAALQGFLAYLPKLLTALVIFLIGALIADKIKDAVETVTKTMGISGARVIAQIVYAVILVMVIITALNIAGIDTTLISNNILVIMGSMLLAFGIAYGFAAKDILTNILSSYYGKARLKPGSKVRIGSDEGVITKIDSISIVLDCGDKEVHIPTNKLITERIEVFK